MVQQQSVKLHVHILIQLFFFPRQVVQEMINTNKKKVEKKAVTFGHDAAEEKTTSLSETWRKLFDQIYNI